MLHRCDTALHASWGKILYLFRWLLCSQHLIQFRRIVEWISGLLSNCAGYYNYFTMSLAFTFYVRCVPLHLSHLRTCVTDMSPDDQWRFDWFTSQSNVATWDIIHEVYKQPPVFEIPPFIRKWKVNLWFHSVKNYGIFNTSCVLCTQWDNKSTYYTISNLRNSNLHIAH